MQNFRSVAQKMAPQLTVYAIPSLFPPPLTKYKFITTPSLQNIYIYKGKCIINVFDHKGKCTYFNE